MAGKAAFAREPMWSTWTHVEMNWAPEVSRLAALVAVIGRSPDRGS